MKRANAEGIALPPTSIQPVASGAGESIGCNG
jgi:hypothetical protein